ncbi:MAG: hypothetical protein QM679_12070 [Patulibacter sp.]
MAVTGIAGCGSDSDSGSTSGGSGDGDGKALLNAMTVTPNGAALKSGTFGVTVTGSVDDAAGKDVRKLDGTAAVTVSAEQLDTAKGMPPLQVTFDVDGDYTSGSGKSGTAKYAGGFRYVSDQLYVTWKDTDYAFGKELSKQFLAGFSQGFANEAGDTKSLQQIAADPKKLMSTLALEPGSWLESSKVSDGPELDGAQTVAVTGPVDLKAAATDLRDGLKALPAAFPSVPGIKQLKELGELKDADIKEAEETLTTREATVYIGKDDHLLRRAKLHLAGKDTGKKGTAIDLTIQLDSTKVNQAQSITAPKSASPVTDLFAQLEKDFPGFGSLLGG